MIKVLNVLTSDLRADGISNCVINYYKNIDNRKVKIDFVASSVDESKKQVIEENGGKIFIIKNRKKRPLKYIKELAKVIKDGKYDIVHAHGSSAILCLEMIAAKRAGCKIRIAHSHNTRTEHKLLDKMLRPIFYKTYTYAFACGKDAGKWLFGNRKFEVINNGRNIEEFEYKEEIRKEIRNKYNLNDKIVIGHVGTFNEQKNHEYLIEIFNQLSKINNKYFLVLIGSGKLQENIKEKVRQLGLENMVLFVGVSQEVGKWIQAMDIMVLPSKFEGFPLVLVEWQIAGLPCLISDKVTKEAKLTELVEFASIEEEPQKWAEQIEKIEIEDRKVNKEKILSEIKEKCFDIKENAKKLETIYNSLLSEEEK